MLSWKFSYIFHLIVWNRVLFSKNIHIIFVMQWYHDTDTNALNIIRT